MTSRAVTFAFAALALIALVSIVGAIVIVLSDRAVPDFLSLTVATCVGAIAGALTARQIGGTGG